MPNSTPRSKRLEQAGLEQAGLEQEWHYRRTIRANLADWAELALAATAQKPAAHHRLLLGALTDIATGHTDRLMLLMPPGSAKSTYASVLFPPWFLARHPGAEIIAASHTAELAENFGRRARDLTKQHEKRLGIRLAPDQRAAGRWEVLSPSARPLAGKTDQRGRYLAAGVRGPIIGRRADLAIIDDPVKSQAEAESPTLRDAIWGWYRADLLTRLKPGGRIVLIMTRWHEDDLAGRLLASQGDEWRTLRLPALAEADDPLGRPKGAALWPEWEDRAAIERKRATLGARRFAALFQQDPRPAEGALFSPARITLLGAAPDTSSGKLVRAWDLAATPKRADNNPDWTVGLKLQRDEAGRFIVLDIVRLRGSPHAVELLVQATARADGDVFQYFPKDPGQAPGFQEALFARLLAGFRFGFSAERGSKTARAAPVAAQMEAGNLSAVRAAWNADFLEELRGFPDTGHDDQVDALSRAFSWLVMERPPAAPARMVMGGWMGR